ncbi:hypothetical protein TVAG_067950 [Trichomonas vaginalis G3]|uniref:Leucine Rich Repeat family protein n=1 Tax=Trichomonas vaginalis (strain ATCC PRA-98 / G3) TaxID=412133 RepID=A2EMH9_TRIV3|nr:leucine-rich repeat-containing protein 34 family [Trichomonas vaginalis G3]EAY06135.1 hypothetical protein TVAG_067950 [Trichomonas vaginalis G3]KAI5516958.1 leucine-rich repeat-containing protein 34 family [Trichomonas vaginalis G3]|eukprot:XP_001318358.1 hypothetical protein [Trichomonas vaginalis G3]
MNKNENVLSRVKPISKIGSELVLGCMKILHFVNGKTIKACLLATEFEFIVLEKTSHDQDLQIVVRFFWDELNLLVTQSDSRIYAKTAKTEIEFEIQNAFQVCLSMHTYCTRLGGKCKLDSDRIKPQVPTSLWFLYKFKYSLFKRGISPPQYLVNEIESSLRQNLPTLDLNKIRCSNKYLPDLLNAFVDANCFKEIVFPASDKDTNWKLIIPFIQSMKYYETITFAESINTQLSQVVTALQSNNDTKLQNISFIKSKINSENMPLFSKLITCRRFSKLTLIDAIETNYIERFIKEFSELDSSKLLDTIVIKDTPTLPVDLLMKNLPSIKTFEFHNCQVQVDTIFPYLSNSNLKGIVVDGGVVSGKELDRILISPTIVNFTFSHIRWENYSLISMWCRILNHTPQSDFISMDLSYAQTGPQSWNSFFQVYCGSHAKTIKSINWSGNQIAPVFLQFCASSQNLNTLQLDGCYTAQTSNCFVSDFADMMKSNKYITELIIRGIDESSRADSSISRFLEALATNQTLLSLDLSGQPLGDNGLSALGNLLLQNKKIRKIKFDGSLDTTYDVLQHFFQKLSSRDAPCDIEWPFQEIAKLRNLNGISASSVNKLRQYWKTALSGGKSNDLITDIEEEPDISLVDVFNGSSSAFDEFSNSPLWKIDLPPIPEPDNSHILQNAASEYSVAELLKLMMQKSD